MTKKGLTIVELLGAIVIFGLLSSLVAIMISFIMSSSNRISEQSNVTSISTNLTVFLEQRYLALSPTNFETCNSSDCIMFELEYAYVVNEANNSIELITYTPPQTLRIELLDGLLMIDGMNYDLKDFTLDRSSSITYQYQSQTLSVWLELILVGQHDQTYTITWQKQMLVTSIPSS